MCIEKVESWAFGGKNYPTELEAVKAALTEIGTRMVKVYHGQPLEGLLELGADISDLRLRYYALTAPCPVGGKEPSEKDAGEPKSGPAGGDHDDPLSTYNLTTRYMAIPRHSPVYKAVKLWLDREGYVSFEAATQNSRGPKRQELSLLIGVAKEPGL